MFTVHVTGSENLSYRLLVTGRKTAGILQRDKPFLSGLALTRTNKNAIINNHRPQTNPWHREEEELEHIQRHTYIIPNNEKLS